MKPSNHLISENNTFSFLHSLFWIQAASIHSKYILARFLLEVIKWKLTDFSKADIWNKGAFILDFENKKENKKKVIECYNKTTELSLEFQSTGASRAIKKNTDDPYKIRTSLRSVAGLVIQAIGRTEFEDGLRPGSPGRVLSDNPSFCTISLITPVL